MFNKRLFLISAVLCSTFFINGCSHSSSLQSEKNQIDKDAQQALRLAHVLRDNNSLEAALGVYEKMDQRGQLQGSYLLEFASLVSQIRSPQESLRLFNRAYQDLLTLNKTATKLSTPTNSYLEISIAESGIPAIQKIALCLGMGRAHLALGLITQAEEDFRCVISIDPANAQAFNGLGVTLNQQGKMLLAEQSFKSALQEKPGYAVAINNLALLQLTLGNNSESIALLRKAGSSGDISLTLNLALAYILADDEISARDTLSSRLEDDYVNELIANFMALKKRVTNGANISNEFLVMSQIPLQLKD